MPSVAAAGAHDAVRLMVELGWPIAIRGGDWKASALNHAVFQGNPDLTAFLLDHGASWTEEHAFGDNVLGDIELRHAQYPHPGGDWAACARVLREHGASLA